jgi:hypothetical protein
MAREASSNQQDHAVQSLVYLSHAADAIADADIVDSVIHKYCSLSEISFS